MSRVVLRKNPPGKKPPIPETTLDPSQAGFFRGGFFPDTVKSILKCKKNESCDIMVSGKLPPGQGQGLVSD